MKTLPLNMHLPHEDIHPYERRVELPEWEYHSIDCTEKYDVTRKSRKMPGRSAK